MLERFSWNQGFPTGSGLPAVFGSGFAFDLHFLIFLLWIIGFFFSRFVLAFWVVGVCLDHLIGRVDLI
jgi:hypothetical protein